MDYHILREFADSWGLVFMLLVFLAAVAWVLRPGVSFRDQSQIPFKHDDEDRQDG